MKSLLLSLLAMLSCGLLAQAQLPTQSAPGMKKLGISDIKPTAALIESVSASGRKNSLERVVQALGSHLEDAVHNTRKFEIIARNDLSSIVKEADFSGDKLKVSGVDFLLVTNVTDFQDFMETREFKALGKSATQRVIRFATIAKIYDSATGKLIESTNFPLETRDQNENAADSSKNGELSDTLLQQITEQMAGFIANRIADVIFPAKIISKLDKQVTINRGEGSGLLVGQLLIVYALGQEMIDPDTGASLGREEMQVGKVRVLRLTPKTCIAEITEDTGIDKGAILRASK